MKKKIFAVIGIGIITVTALAGCSQESIDTGAVTTVADTTVQSTTTEPQATTKPAESTTKADESSTTEKATTKKGNSTTTTKAAVAKTTAKQTTAAKTATSSSTITLEKAKSIALKKAGVSASGVTFTTASKWDDGNYHIAFYNSSKKFSFIISASGTVLSSDTTPNTTTKATTTNKYKTNKDLQKDVFAYIRSQINNGANIVLDSSLNLNNSSWGGYGGAIYIDAYDPVSSYKYQINCIVEDAAKYENPTSVYCYCYNDKRSIEILWL